MKLSNKKSNAKSKGVDYWTKRISDQEMPALCSTVKTLEKLAKDDVSSLGLLGKSVMHDNALTSRILRVANSATYSKGVSHVTTVSRASVVLGFDTIRNICITAKLLSSLLESEGLTQGVYQRLIKLMARAFQAAMLAKMMLRDHDEELQEEVFIASLLYHIGESAFWSTGCEEAVELDGQDPLPAELLQQRLKQTADMLEIKVDELKGRMIRCSDATKKLAEAYGARVLIEHLPNPIHLTKDLRANVDAPLIRMPDMNEQLKKLRELTNCAMVKADFNQVITTTLEGILSGVGVDRCGVLLLSPNRKRLQPRIVLGDGAEQMKNEFIITLEQPQCLFCDCIELKQPMFVDDPSSAKWRLYMDDYLKNKTSTMGFMISPLLVEQKVIGIIYADRASSGRKLNQSEFDNFTHFSQLANVCLSVALGH